MDVRRSAVEAMAVLAGNVGPDRLRADAACVETLLAISGEPRGRGRDAGRRGSLRAAAAFTWGVVGGAPAVERLETLLQDPHPDVRFNAALGLARQGHEAAIPVLCTMLDAANGTVVAGEESAGARRWKRDLVLRNAIRAALRLADQRPAADLGRLRAALQKLATSQASLEVRVQAAEAVQALHAADG
jgi:HEAT repeat protein